jgi:hypothetical protein
MSVGFFRRSGVSWVADLTQYRHAQLEQSSSGRVGSGVNSTGVGQSASRGPSKGKAMLNPVLGQPNQTVDERVAMNTGWQFPDSRDNDANAGARSASISMVLQTPSGQCLNRAGTTQIT